jgi:flagellar hook protein FlgE
MSRVGDIARTGLMAADARIANSAHNVANSNTPGFTASRLVTQEGRDGGVTYRPGTTESPSPGYGRDGRSTAPAASDTDLAQETVEQISASAAFKANLSVLKTHDELQRSVLSIKV